ncbi:hypothetical protein [Nonlabens sp. Asnod2-A12]|uniref:hypothetical protein n=1 Tax=Nonlabens sp. Asnod2-A12 TaxID=3160578 RepID=UPI00386B500B
MFKIKGALLLLTLLIISSCEEKMEHEFPIEKRYWDTKDYHSAVLELRYGYKQDEKLPTLDDPTTRVIVEKLTDQQNFKVVLDDTELGGKHRNKVGQDFFEEYRSMSQIYTARDRKDNYLYDEEMLAVEQFGLGLQLRYFKLGNDQVKKQADDPKSASVKHTISNNINVLIGNYLLYLDKINNEAAFSTAGKDKLATGINTYFPLLINTYPDANLNRIKNKAELMLKKSESTPIKNSLEEIINLIDSKQIKDQEEYQ